MVTLTWALALLVIGWDAGSVAWLLMHYAEKRYDKWFPQPHPKQLMYPTVSDVVAHVPVERM